MSFQIFGFGNNQWRLGSGVNFFTEFVKTFGELWELPDALTFNTNFDETWEFPPPPNFTSSFNETWES